MASRQRNGLFTVRFVLAILFLLAGGGVSQAANWYVLKGATGSNNGTSWTNAWNEMNQVNWSSVNCGDTIWLGGGTYTTSLTINKTCTPVNVLNINRVLSTDSVPTAAAGWNSSFDSQVIISSSAEILLNGGAYFTINGRLGTTAGNNFGISVRCTSSGGCEGMGPVNPSGNLDHITVTYVEVVGPSCILVAGGGSGACTGTTDGFNLAPSSNTVTFLLLDHMWIHRWAEAIRTSNWTNCTIQYTDIDTTNPTAGRAEHEDIMYNYANINLTMRYNRIWGSPNDGIFFDFGGTTNFQFYGNYYYHSGAALMTFKSGYSFGTAFIYNNVFENDGTFGDVQPGGVNFNGSMTGGVLENNVFENVSANGTSQLTTADYNAYSTSVGKNDSGAHSFTYNPGTLGSSVLFLNESTSNPVAADFHLTSTGATTLQNGLALPSPYNLDADGNTRGVGGNWYIGAYQYSGSQSQAPQPPTGVVVAVQ